MQNHLFGNLFIGNQYIELEEVDSTNNYALKLIKESTPDDGTLIFSKNQTHGRGQVSNTWESQVNKNITISIILKPTFLKIEEQFLLNKAITLGIFNFIKSIIPGNLSAIKIKWPNDIYYQDKKIAGLLIENIIDSKLFKTSVVGIGINVNQKKFSEKIPNASSLKLICKKEFDIKECMKLLCNNVEAKYLQLKAQKYNIINNEYLRALYRLNENHFYKTKEEIIFGKIIDVSHHGKLILETKNTKFHFNNKEIIFL